MDRSENLSSFRYTVVKVNLYRAPDEVVAVGWRCFVISENSVIMLLAAARLGVLGGAVEKHQVKVAGCSFLKKGD